MRDNRSCVGPISVHVKHAGLGRFGPEAECQHWCSYAGAKYAVPILRSANVRGSCSEWIASDANHQSLEQKWFCRAERPAIAGRFCCAIRGLTGLLDRES